MPQCLQQYLGSFFCHDFTNFNAAKLEIFRVNAFVNFWFSFIGEKISKNKRNSLKTAHDIFELGMIPKGTLSQKRSLHLKGELTLPET